MFEAKLATRVAACLQEGPGLALVDGLLALTPNDLLKAFLDLCICVGAPRVQDDGEIYGHIRPASNPETTENYASAATSSTHLRVHTEHARDANPPRVLALLCVRPALHGGETVVASAGYVHNRLLTVDPAALSRLHRPVPVARHPRSHRDPHRFDHASVFDCLGSTCRTRYPRYWIERALAAAGRRDDELVRSLHRLEDILSEEGSSHAISMRAGEALLLRNDAVLHGRRSFSGDDPPAVSRHFVRVLLD